MKGINYVTNDKGEKVAVMIDLTDHDQRINEYIEDLVDLIEIGARQEEELLEWDQVKEDLKEKGIID